VSGEPDATTVFPNDLQIDYVRIYQPAPALKPAMVVADNKVPEGKKEIREPVDVPMPEVDEVQEEDEAAE
jgi:hypothetical protein